MRFVIVKKLYALLPHDERWKLSTLSGAMVLAGVSQVLGLALVMPFIGLVANPAVVLVNPWMRVTFDFFRVSRRRDSSLWPWGL